MAAILSPDKWQGRPTGQLELDQNHWAYPALIHVVAPSTSPRDLITRAFMSAVGGPTVKATPDGCAVRGNGSSSYYELADSSENSPTKILVVSRVSADSGSGDVSAVSKRLILSNGWNLKTRFTALTGNDFPCFVFYDGAWHIASGTTDIRGGGFKTLVGGYDGAHVRFCLNGGAVSATAYWSSLGDTTETVKLGGDLDGAVPNADISLFYLLDGNRADISASAMQELGSAPWQIFRKQPRILYFTAPSGGGATIAGSFAATESAVDTAAFAGDVLVSGSFTGTDSVDTTSFSGLVKVAGSFAPTESAVDSAAFTGNVVTAGIPTLSSPTVTGVTATAATPRVTITFA